MSYIQIASDVVSCTFKSNKSAEEAREILRQNSCIWERTEYEDEFDGRRSTNMFGWTAIVWEEKPKDGTLMLYVNEKVWNEEKEKDSTFYDHWEDTQHLVEINSHFIKWNFASGKKRNLLTAEITKMYTTMYMLGFTEDYFKVSERVQHCIKKFVDRIKEETNKF